ncbi:MAG: hypothetical protein SNJ82_06595, partial [Gemmataceae bacterium]
PRGKQYVAWGPGQQLRPPVPLGGPEFVAFQRACAYFVGFQAIDHHAYLARLQAAVQNNPPHWTTEGVVFCTRLITAFPQNGNGYYYRAVVHQQLGLPELAHLDAQEALRLGTEYAAAAREILLPG